MKLLADIIKEIQPQKALFEVTRMGSAGGYLEFGVRKQQQEGSTDPISNLITSSKIERVRLSDLVAEVNHKETLDNAYYKLWTFCKNFIYANSGLPNPKLTPLYQWVDMFFNTRTFQNNPTLELDILNIYKYIVCMPNGSTEAIESVKLFEFIKQKYEKKGLINDRVNKPSRRRRRSGW
jgi:hypothetical protein